METMKEQICQFCGKIYNSKRKSKYCSKECCREANKENQRKNYVGTREKSCIQCGCELPKFKTRFCSKDCGIKWNRSKRGINTELIKKNCVICGKEFETYKSRKTTCSQQCSKKYENKYDSERDRKRYAESHPDYISQEDRHKMHLERLERLEKEKAEKQKILARKQKERQKILAEKKKIKQANIMYWQQYNEEHTCIACGNKYTAHHPFSKYCSRKCERKSHPRARERERLKGKIIDRDISLVKVAKINNDTCQICGLKVDWTDKREINGVVVCGDYYPSIDHIKPISKGGLHSWDNVWLAHRKCNTYKSDKIMF